VVVDVAVVGAGAFGLSTALHCALRGASVTVVERRSAGSQASGRAAGLFKSIQADEFRTGLARRSIDKICTFADWAGVPVEVMRSGSVMVARTEQYARILEVEATRSRGWGVDVEPLGPSVLDERVSYYRPSGGESAVWCPGDVYVEEPGDVIDAYMVACRAHGVEVLEGEPVVAITTTAGQVDGLETAVRRIRTRVLVDAAGAWSRMVGELADADVAVAPTRHQLLITEPSVDVASTDPITRIIDAASYLRPARGGLMFGGFESDPLAVDPRRHGPDFDTDDVPLDLARLHQMAEEFVDEAPLARQGRVVDHRAGMFTMTPDGRFVIGPVPQPAGFWVASGCNGSGFSMSLALGAGLADWIVDGQPPAGFDTLAPGRFGVISDDALAEKGIWYYTHYYDTD
jgi:glycine/D-amino acid oxidase-like deaminating enzyme